MIPIQIIPIKRSKSVSLAKQKCNDRSMIRLSIDGNNSQENKQMRRILPFRQSKNNILIDQSNMEISPVQCQRRITKLTKIQKPLLCLQNKRGSFRKTEISGSLECVPSSFQNLFSILENNFILQQKPGNVFLFKRQDLESLLQTILFHKQIQKKQRLLQNNQNFYKAITTLWEMVEAKKRQNKLEKNNFFQTVRERIISFDYQQQCSQQKSNIVELEAIRKTKEAEVNESKQVLGDLVLRKQAILKIICEKERFLYELQEKCAKQEKELASMQADTVKKSQFLRRVQESESAILNFVENQEKNKIIKMVSEDFKRIQGDIYEYAVYLQANQLASSLTYEHIPMVCHTNSLDEEMAALSKTIIQNQQMPIINKCRMIRDFLLGVVQRYRKKDQEVEKMMNFKTRCIIKFVDKMKMWLSNWQLKQEYLKNLRIEQALTHEKLIKLLDNFGEETLCQECQESIQSQRQELLNLCLKIDQNYKMGNSFY